MNVRGRALKRGRSFTTDVASTVLYQLASIASTLERVEYRVLTYHKGEDSFCTLGAVRIDFLFRSPLSNETRLPQNSNTATTDSTKRMEISISADHNTCRIRSRCRNLGIHPVCLAVRRLALVVHRRTARASDFEHLPLPKSMLLSNLFLSLRRPSLFPRLSFGFGLNLGRLAVLQGRVHCSFWISRCGLQTILFSKVQC